MSYTETHSGTIKPFVQPFGENYMDWAKESLKLLGVEYDSKWYNDELEQLLSDYCDEYDYLIRIGDNLYEIDDMTIDDEMCVITKLPDGTYKYLTRFYNGGTYLNEVIKDKLISDKLV